MDDQSIPMGWEEVVMDLAAEILADPTQKRYTYTSIIISVSQSIANYSHHIAAVSELQCHVKCSMTLIPLGCFL